MFSGRVIWIVLIVSFGFGYGAALKPVYDFDVDWHLAAGRWMVENKEVVRADPFSYTFRGQEWVSITWLHEVLTWLIFRCGGDALLVVVISIVPGLTIMAVVLTSLLLLGPKREAAAQRVLPWGVTAAGLSAAMIAQYRWAARPEIWSYLLGCLMILLVSTYLLRPGRYIYFGILVQLIWVNTHGIFVMGPAFYVLGLVLLTFSLLCRTDMTADVYNRQVQDLKRFILASGGVILACFLNPRGVKGALWPLHLFDVLKSKTFSLMIPEAIPPFGDDLLSHDSKVLLVVMVLYALVLVAMWFRLFLIKREPLSGPISLVWICGFIIFLVTVYTALSARRNLPLVLLWPLPFVLFSLFHVFKERYATLLVFIVCLTTIWSEGDSIIRSKMTLLGGFRNYDRMPERTARFLEKNDVFGNTFTTVSDANYFLRRLYGRFRPYIDSRFAELYNEEHFQRYMNILAQPPLLDQEVERMNIDNVVVGHHLPLATSLLGYLASRSDTWQLVHLDEMAAVFIKRGTRRYQEWADQAAAIVVEDLRHLTETGALREYSLDRLTGLGRGLALINRYDQAHLLFQEAFRREPGDYEVAAGYCNVAWLLCFQQETFPDCAREVRQICQQAMDLSPNSLQAVVASGIVNRALGDLEEAIRLFQRATEIDRNSYESFVQWADTLHVLGQQQNDQTRLFEAAEKFWLAARLRPYAPEPHFYRAEILVSLNLLSDAEESYRQALVRAAEGPFRTEIKQRLNTLGVVNQ